MRSTQQSTANFVLWYFVCRYTLRVAHTTAIAVVSYICYFIHFGGHIVCGLRIYFFFPFFRCCRCRRLLTNAHTKQYRAQIRTVYGPINGRLDTLTASALANFPFNFFSLYFVFLLFRNCFDFWLWESRCWCMGNIATRTKTSFVLSKLLTISIRCGESVALHTTTINHVRVLCGYSDVQSIVFVYRIAHRWHQYPQTRTV